IGILKELNIIEDDKLNTFYIDYIKTLLQDLNEKEITQENIERNIKLIITLHPIKRGKDSSEISLNINTKINTNVVQEIVYGAPGTGKSFYISQEIEGLEENTERVTFYDGYSHNNFVGAYKPISVDNNIIYEFVSGPLFRVLTKAYLNPEEPYYLVIEEINRASADKVFGNIFQLLDRKDNGESEYPISLSEEQDEFLKKQLKDAYDKTISRRKGLYLPSNLSIYATMNSGDQNVYPLDAAFKRRWDFKYIGLNDNKDSFGKTEYTYKLKIANDKKVDWEVFRSTINSILLQNGIREDKLLAPFFIKPISFTKKEDTSLELILDDKIFEGKVLMYLYEDVLRYTDKSIIFDEEINSFTVLLENYKATEKTRIFSENFYSELDNSSLEN
ncbi:MAG: AAA family ATPase, partial [Cetobacterium sp.]